MPDSQSRPEPSPIEPMLWTAVAYGMWDYQETPPFERPPFAECAMNTEPLSPTPTVTGLADTRGLSLAQLAGKPAAASESLRHVLPAEEPERLVVCAFASSI